MARSVRALIEPRLLRWARKTDGIGIGDATKRVRLSPEQIEAWEQGEVRSDHPAATTPAGTMPT